MTNDRERFEQVLDELQQDPKILKMQKFSQHQGNTTLQHCRNVALYSFQLAERLHWKVDEEALARGAMLHDYYLYSIQDKGVSAWRHGTGHPQTALDNARKDFTLNRKEENIIRSHMWPLTITHVPASKEALLVSMADKYCASREMLTQRGEMKPGVNEHWIRRGLKHRAGQGAAYLHRKVRGEA